MFCVSYGIFYDTILFFVVIGVVAKNTFSAG